VTDATVGVAGERLGNVPYLRPHPGPAIFERRAARFRALAHRHALSDFLELCASLSAAQATAAAGMDVRLPERDLPPSRPLRALGANCDGWRGALARIVHELSPVPMPDASRQGLSRLADMGSAQLTTLAERILAGQFVGLDLAAALFAAAAMQVQLVTVASQVGIEGLVRSEAGCPMCGAPPVAGIVLGDARLRYLACPLCASQWHLTRVTCSRCRSTGGISYLALDGDPGGVKAEACAGCMGYLKLFYLEQRPAADPVADDLATLALDQLVHAEGYARVGVNLFLPV